MPDAPMLSLSLLDDAADFGTLDDVTAVPVNMLAYDATFAEAPRATYRIHAPLSLDAKVARHFVLRLGRWPWSLPWKARSLRRS